MRDKSGEGRRDTTFDFSFFARSVAVRPAVPFAGEKGKGILLLLPDPVGRRICSGGKSLRGARGRRKRLLASKEGAGETFAGCACRPPRKSVRGKKFSARGGDGGEEEIKETLRTEKEQPGLSQKGDERKIASENRPFSPLNGGGGGSNCARFDSRVFLLPPFVLSCSPSPLESGEKSSPTPGK